MVDAVLVQNSLEEKIGMVALLDAEGQYVVVNCKFEKS